MHFFWGGGGICVNIKTQQELGVKGSNRKRVNDTLAERDLH